jgi:hypothetical protein
LFNLLSSSQLSLTHSLSQRHLQLAEFKFLLGKRKRKKEHAVAGDRLWEEERSPSLSSLYLYPLLKSWGVWVLV